MCRFLLYSSRCAMFSSYRKHSLLCHGGGGRAKFKGMERFTHRGILDETGCLQRRDPGKERQSAHSLADTCHALFPLGEWPAWGQVAPLSSSVRRGGPANSHSTNTQRALPGCQLLPCALLSERDTVLTVPCAATRKPKHSGAGSVAALGLEPR